MVAIAGIKQRAAELPVGEGARAALAYQVECPYMPRKTESLVHVARKSRTEIACTGRYDDGIDFSGVQARALQGEPASLRRQLRCVFRKSPLQYVSIDFERLCERPNREPARVHAVVACQHESGERPRSRIEAPKPLGRCKRIPAFGTRIPPIGHGGSHRAQKHGLRRADCNGSLKLRHRSRERARRASRFRCDRIGRERDNPQAQPFLTGRNLNQGTDPRHHLHRSFDPPEVSIKGSLKSNGSARGRFQTLLTASMAFSGSTPPGLRLSSCSAEHPVQQHHLEPAADVIAESLRST